ncbi:Uncharacterised protein [Mycobacterium tuberculosis]|nr:Uncharacterised protein [Mycobacterium tuberculosis]
MARVLQMPDETTLPPGPRRAFVRLLFDYYTLARRPTLEAISDQINSKDRSGTASRETIRRMMHGHTVPRNWQTVEVVFLALCELGEVEPDLRVKAYNERIDETVIIDRRSQMEEAWHAALDGKTLDQPRFLGVDFDNATPVHTGGFGSDEGFGGSGGFGGRVPASDPWASGGGFSTDPPF